MYAKCVMCEQCVYNVKVASIDPIMLHLCVLHYAICCAIKLVIILYQKFSFSYFVINTTVIWLFVVLFWEGVFNVPKTCNFMEFVYLPHLQMQLNSSSLSLIKF